jgi:cation:H+ antiporter
MFFLLHGVLIILYLIAIIYTCSIFTNAVEISGSKMKLGNSATGGILAVIGTTLPETIIPVIAIFNSCFFQNSTGADIATGAIIGSPFMLSTMALFMVGISLIFKKRKELNVNINNFTRFYKYFLIAYTVGILSSFLHNYSIKLFVSVLLISSYVFFVKRTFKKSKEEFSESEVCELLFCKIFKIKNENMFVILFQVIISMILLCVFSQLFIEEITIISKFLNCSAIILSLIITPFATELPECINSIIWTKDFKDELAISNILGAVVFQSVIPMSIGILFTNWVLDKTILLNSFLVILCSIIMVTFVKIKRKISIEMLLFCSLFYFGYIIFVFLK